MRDEEIDRVIERVRAGDTAAYREVVRHHQRDVWRVVAFALSRPEETEDLVQQAFVLAYQQLDRFERGRDFGAWLRGIARNLARAELRRRAREDRRMDRYLHYLEAQAPDDRGPDTREERLRRALAECREHLPESAKEALALRYDRAWSFASVARALGRTVAGARQLLQRARLDLRHCIEGKLT